MKTYFTYNEAETDLFGEKLLEILPEAGVVALIGTLGAGKTRLVQAITKAAKVDPSTVSSPTFVLVHEYKGEKNGKVLPFYHFDAYRLKNEDEFLELGPDEYFERDGLCFIEWADRVESALPERRMEIFIEVLGETERKFTVRELV
ncbi:MAG: tRNA (adenosine(37)-N6)-threonylcarbamoyltransferase complex ATPase subunit type 1 TsaE [Thermoguttaceae bacterium]